MSATQAKPDVTLTSSSGNERPVETTGLRLLRAFGTWLFGTGYAIWLGGLIALGAFMAPNVAATLHSPVVVAGGEPLRRAILNGIVGNSFRVLGAVCYWCYWPMALGLFIELRRRSAGYRRWTTPLIFLLIAAGLVMVESSSFLSSMDAAQARGDMQRFDALHHAYERNAMIQFALLLVIGGVKALRDGFARND
jgi:hypothetical protein